MLEKPCFASDRVLVMQILQVQAVQGVLDVETLDTLLTEKLSTVDIASLVGDESACFWLLFKSCFELVSNTLCHDFLINADTLSLNLASSLVHGLQPQYLQCRLTRHCAQGLILQQQQQSRML